MLVAIIFSRNCTTTNKTKSLDFQDIRNLPANFTNQGSKSEYSLGKKEV